MLTGVECGQCARRCQPQPAGFPWHPGRCLTMVRGDRQVGPVPADGRSPEGRSPQLQVPHHDDPLSTFGYIDRVR